MKKVNALVLGLAVLLAFGCGDKDKREHPEPDLNAPATPACLLVQGGEKGYTTNYSYNSVRALTRIDYTSPNLASNFETIEYNAEGKIVRNNYFLQDSTLAQYRTYLYNTNGQINRISGFIKTSPSDPFEETGYETLAYDAAGRLIERGRYSSPHATYAYSKYEYTHRPDGVIVEKSYSNYTAANNFNLDGIREYRYDNQQNPYAALSNAINMNIFTHHNVVSVRDYDLAYTTYSENLITYQYNAQSFPIKVIYSDGQNQYVNALSYNCQ